MKNQSPSEIFLEEIEAKSIFKDEKRLSIDFIPEEIPHRTEEFRDLVRYFKSIIGDGFRTARQFVMITGPIGVGKTLLSKKFGLEMEKYANKLDNNLVYRHVNCRKNRTPFLILNTLLKSVNPFFPSRGFATEELIDFLKKSLERDNAHLLLCLDEVDYIQNGTSDIIYTLTRLNDEVAGPNSSMVSLIIISKNKHFLYGLDNSARSSLMKNSILLSQYKAEQLLDILNFRAKEGFNDDSIDEGVLDYIAELGAEKGDARYALELLWRSGKLADQKKSEKILPEYVRLATASIYPFPREIISSLSLHQKIVTFSIADLVESSNLSYVTLNEIRECYNEKCIEYNIQSRKRVQFWNYIQELKNIGIITTRVTQKDNIRRITLIGIPAIPLEELKIEIEKQIIGELKINETNQKNDIQKNKELIF